MYRKSNTEEVEIMLKEKMAQTLSITDEHANYNKIVVMLAIPAILEQLSHIVVQYVDAAMVGGLGAYATAAVGINSSTNVLIGGIQQAIGVGFCVQIAMAIGSKDTSKIKQVVQQAILIAFLTGAIMTISMQVIGNYSPIWLGAEEEVIPHAIVYIKIVSAALIFRTVSIVSAALLRGAGDTRTPFYINLAANVVNIIGNYFLISAPHTLQIGKYSINVWGANLGVAGAALATAASMIFSGVGLFIYLCKAKTPVKYVFNGGWKLEKEILIPTGKVAGPIALERFVLAAGQIALTAMVAHLGTIAVASHYIVNTVATITYETSMGFSSAGTTLTAQCIGARKEKLAYRYSIICLKIGILISVGFSSIVMLFTQNLVGLFTTDVAVIALSVFIVRMDAVSEPLFGISTVLCGVFRGYGDTKFPFWVSFIGIIITRLSLGYLFGYLLDIGLLGIWIGIFVDIVIRGIMCLWHLRRYRVK